MATSPVSSRRLPGLPGRWIVLGMFAFGLTATGILYLYWHLHNAPFLPLQKAIVKEFPDSAPRVEGGQRKMHKGTPRTLRITMKVESNPNSPEAEADLNAIAEKVLQLSEQHLSLDKYDQLEIHFFWPEPEEEIQRKSILYSLEDPPRRLPHPEESSG